MQEKVYLNIFILCTILSSGILAKFLEEDIGESSNLLIREKRVIDRSPGGDNPDWIGAVPYIVNLKKNGHLHCAGTILSHRTVITAARCVPFDVTLYTLLSGSVNTNAGHYHNVTGKKMYDHSPSRAQTFLTGIALITVNPPFVYSITTRNIDLHAGPLFAGMEGTVSGWATHVGQRGRVQTVYVRRLRSITVPIITHQECKNIYRNHYPISDKEICTFHADKQCGFTDSGAPFVIDNQLVGIYIGEIFTTPSALCTKPDVFALVQNLEYGTWIRENIVH